RKDEASECVMCCRASANRTGARVCARPQATALLLMDSCHTIHVGIRCTCPRRPGRSPAPARQLVAARRWGSAAAQQRSSVYPSAAATAAHSDPTRKAACSPLARRAHWLAPSLSATGPRRRAVAPHPQLYRTAYASPQLELLELDEEQWR